MSRYFSKRHEAVSPYIPGEQPQDRKYIKLNTNELPYPPSPLAQKLARQEAGDLNLYSDPDCRLLISVAAEKLGIREDQIMFGNGSDEILNYAVMAYCDEDTDLVVPDVTYSFYKTIAAFNRVGFRQIPVTEELEIRPQDFFWANGTVLFANPNAPTGIALSLRQIEEIVLNNPDNIVIVDEAYIDFGGESALTLINDYDNLLVTRTFSKGSALAGARLGFVAGNSQLISDLNTLRNASNPYNINRMTMMAGIGVFCDPDYLELCVSRIRKTRQKTCDRLRELGFTMTDSSANFIFVRHPDYPGRKLYQDLKDKGILVRHFNTERLTDYIRISIGTNEEMDAVMNTIKVLLEENA